MLVTVCAQSGLFLLEHTHVVEHATYALLGQRFPGQSDSTLRKFAASDGQRLESGYGTRVLGAHPTLRSQSDSSPVSSVATTTVRCNREYCETKLHRLISSMSRNIMLL